MKKIHFPTFILIVFVSLFSVNAHSAVKKTALYNNFIDKMVKQHQFDKAELDKLFKSVAVKQSILKAISRPAEGMPWHKYRKIFIRDKRIAGGVKFWKDNQATLEAVEKQYGVPPEIVTAIIGVETLYGKHTGNYRVIDALSTLGFAYPKRSKFFLKELEQFLLLCREEKMNPLKPLGSYAGAMGRPQFMPSSYRAYAADFEQDKKRDIWANNADVIASVANYFAVHRWKKDQPVAFQVSSDKKDYGKLIKKGLKPDTTVQQLEKAGIKIEASLAKNEPIKLFKFKQKKHDDLWIGLHNFYVITRYNHSQLYALAVYQLSQAILEQKQSNEKN